VKKIKTSNYGCALNHVRFRAAMNPTWFRAECGVKKNTIRKETGDGEIG
jgi:hypothetical protein